VRCSPPELVVGEGVCGYSVGLGEATNRLVVGLSGELIRGVRNLGQAEQDCHKRYCTRGGRG